MTVKMHRWAAALVGVFGLVLSLLATPHVALAATGTGSVHTYRATPGDIASERFQLSADGTDVFVARYANRSNNRVHVARFASGDTTPTLTVTNDAPITSWKIYPERDYPAGSVQVSGNTMTFDMSDQLRYALVSVNGTSPMLAIINDPEEDPATVPAPDGANVVNVADYVSDLSGATDQTAGIRAAIDALYDDPTKDTLFFPDGAYQYAGLELRNRTKPVTIYVDEGALLKNRIQPTMTAMEPAIGIWDSANITISGRGVFDANGFANYDTANGGWRHDANSSHHQGGAMIVRSQNIVFNDTLVRDAKQWNWETHTAKNVTFNNIKGLTPYAQPWIDGLDLASGQDLTVNGAFTLGNDDTFASGHYNPDDGFVDDVANPDRLNWDTEDSFGYSINNTLGWSAGAGNAIRLGHAAYGHSLKSYSFDNVNYVGFSGGGNGITVQNSPDSGVRNYPRYESISVKDSSFDTSLVGTDFSILGKQSSDPTDRIGSVVLDNVWFSNELPAQIANVENLRIRDLTLAGTKVTRLTQTRLTFSNVIHRDLDFAEDVAPVIEPLADQSVDVGDHLRFTVRATDGDGDAVTLSTDGELPSGATFDAGTGVFDWTPGRAQTGKQTLTFVATDARGASSTATAQISVNDPTAHTITVLPTADTNVQSWNTEEGLNYGDNEHLRVLNFNTASRGPLGELYNGGQTSQDAKITYLDFDLAPYVDELRDTDLVDAELSLTYFGPSKTALTGTNTLEVARVLPTWIEGNGKTTPTARTNTVAGAMTWLNKAQVDTSQVIESAPFSVAATAKVGSDATYGASQAPVGSVATTDVTPFVASLDQANHLRVAINETKKQDLLFVSREGAARNAKAAGMAPTLTVTVRDKVDRTALQAALDEYADRQVVGFTADSWGPFATARDDAQRLLADNDATQHDVDGATTALRDAGTALEPAVTALTVTTSKSSYPMGSTFDPSVLSVIAQRADGTSSTLTLDDVTVSGFDSSQEQTVTLRVEARDGLVAAGGDPVVGTVALTITPKLWDATATYVSGQRVTYDDAVWLASWWTRGQQPGDPYGPWQEIRTAGDGTAVWTASRIFVAGDTVVHQGQRYRAKWWTRNQVPGDKRGPWQPLVDG